MNYREVSTTKISLFLLGLGSLISNYLDRPISYEDVLGKHTIYLSEDKSSQLERIVRPDGKLFEKVHYVSRNRPSYLVKNVLIDNCEFQIETMLGYSSDEQRLLYDPITKGINLESYGNYGVFLFGECDEFSKRNLVTNTQEIFNKVREHSLDRN